MSRYWLHRISNEYNVSIALLMNKGYLSLGWSDFAKSDILEYAQKDDAKGFELECKKHKCENIRSRWAMWHFGRFAKNDTVVVPLPCGNFTICRVCERAKPISKCEKEIGAFPDNNNKVISWTNGRLVRQDQPIDIGFVVKVEIIPKEKQIARSKYADAALTARMKMRQTNGEIIDGGLIESVENVKNNKIPVNFHDVAIKGANIIEEAFESLTPAQFESLVEAYMKKMGADDVFIPTKNEHGKENGADTDVVAVFESLKIAILIQVKRHIGKTNEKAIIQIREYTNQLKDPNSELNYGYTERCKIIPWVISSADFTLKAKEAAKEGQKGELEEVRLINGKEFAEMLMESGISTLNKI